MAMAEEANIDGRKLDFYADGWTTEAQYRGNGDHDELHGGNGDAMMIVVVAIRRHTMTRRVSAR